MDLQRSKRSPLHILISYGLCFTACVGGLDGVLWGYTITLATPLVDCQRKQHLESYEMAFVGMKRVMIMVYMKLSNDD